MGAAGTLTLLACAFPVSAGGAEAPLPNVQLKTPGKEGVARKPTVHVLVEAQDCSAPPTVTVAATWRRRSGRATLEIDGRKRLVHATPRPFAVRTDRLTFQRVRARGRLARVRVRLMTDWLNPSRVGEACEMRLPRLIGQGASASAAARGVVRLRTTASVASTSRTPRRTTATDRVWTCGGASTAAFDCGVRASLSVPAPTATATPAKPPARDGDDGDPPEGAIPLLALLAALAAGGVAIGASKRSKDGPDVTETWNDRARKEFDKPDETISARASDLTKIGAPVAAFIAAIAASIGGWVSDANPDVSIIAVAVVVATAVGGLFYVFAADFKSRAAGTVARFNTLAALAGAEAKATAAAEAEADAKVREAQAQSKAHIEGADKAKAAAEKDQAEATKARESAAAKEATLDQKLEEAWAKAEKAAAENAELKKALEACRAERADRNADQRAKDAEATAARANARIAELEEALQRCRQTGSRPLPEAVLTPELEPEPAQVPPISEVVHDFEELADKLAAIARSFKRSEE